jgi:hypothetical protein
LGRARASRPVSALRYAANLYRSVQVDAGKFSMKVFEGGHFYTETQSAALIVQRSLCNVLSDCSAGRLDQCYVPVLEEVRSAWSKLGRQTEVVQFVQKQLVAACELQPRSVAIGPQVIWPLLDQRASSLRRLPTHMCADS